MYCITKGDMKFDDYFIPARTKATVINKPQYVGADIPGMCLKLVITLWDMLPEAEKRKGVPISRTKISNELEGRSFNVKSEMIGIVITTNGTQVYMDAGDDFYFGVTLYEWQVKKVFNGEIPKDLYPKQGTNTYYLQGIIDYLEDKFEDWVKNNCNFHILTKQDIENGDGFDGAYPGDKTLSPKGMQQFEQKKLEYQNRLEAIGFTYDFKGGLIWD